MMTNENKLLEVKNLCIDYHTSAGTVHAVEDVSFTLYKGESIGLVGESGCGKTTVAKSVMRMLAENGEISGGEMLFKGRDIVKMSDKEVRDIRLKEIAMIAQSAMNSLNPVHRVGSQIVEGILAHSDMSKDQAYARTKEVFDIIGLKEDRMNAYPHQLSGGMKQRLVIAMALSLNPSLMIADEPTTALDVVVQDRILKQISQINEEFDSSMIFITHDIAVVSEVCDSIIVMYGGKVMEKATTKVFFKAPFHPYSLGLHNASPGILDIDKELISIPGTPPNLMKEQTGCRFKERCPFREDKCLNEEPELREVDDTGNHVIACHFPERVDEFREKARHISTWKDVALRIEQESEAF